MVINSDAMNLLRVALAIGALLCGVRALGYWAILQLGGLQAADIPGVAWTLISSAFLFLFLSAASAWLATRAGGARAIFARTLFLSAAYGLPCIALFTVASRGAVLQMRGALVLLLLLGCLLLVFRPRTRHAA
jgi:hypothetical protein